MSASVTVRGVVVLKLSPAMFLASYVNVHWVFEEIRRMHRLAFVPAVTLTPM